MVMGADVAPLVEGGAQRGVAAALGDNDPLWNAAPKGAAAALGGCDPLAVLLP
jgi:hypothetical protein